MSLGTSIAYEYASKRMVAKITEVRTFVPDRIAEAAKGTMHDSYVPRDRVLALAMQILDEVEAEAKAMEGDE